MIIPSGSDLPTSAPLKAVPLLKRAEAEATDMETQDPAPKQTEVINFILFDALVATELPPPREMALGHPSDMKQCFGMWLEEFGFNNSRAIPLLVLGKASVKVLG